jgi:hypothetical protein
MRQAALGLVAAAALVWLERARLAIGVGSAAALLGLAALLSPLGLFAAIERLLAALGARIQRALTWLLLPMIFFLFFVPFRALFRRGRRDSMRRFYDPASPSYWQLREVSSAPGAERYRP